MDQFNIIYFVDASVPCIFRERRRVHKDSDTTGRTNMVNCAACGAKLIEMAANCPECGVNLIRPGSFLRLSGWVLIFNSLIPLLLGTVGATRQNLLLLGIGVGILVIGAIAVIAGKIRMVMAPYPTHPSSHPAVPPPQQPFHAIRK
jgi:hypothetical protein